MTYGEYWVTIKMSMEMIQGKWTVYKPLQNMPRQMNREDAYRYYNNKLNNYWRSQNLYRSVNE